MENNITSISEIQDAIARELSENIYFTTHRVPILCENSKTIEYDIKSSISKLGICATVTTPSLTFGGQYGSTEREPYWTMDVATIVVAENPVLNRNRADYATALDTAIQIAQTLNKIPTFGLTSITQTAESGLILATLQFKTNIVFRYETQNL